MNEYASLLEVIALEVKANALKEEAIAAKVKANALKKEVIDARGKVGALKKEAIAMNDKAFNTSYKEKKLRTKFIENKNF